MTLPVILHDKECLAAYLRQDLPLHLYELGDLDDFFWPYTTWYGLAAGANLSALALMYSGERPPVLLALAQPTDRLADLLTRLLPLLPPRFYAHLSAGLEHVFTAFYQAENHGLHHKMVLAHPARLEVSSDYPVEQLTCADLDETLEFYNAAYPGHWFTARMLETGFYYGVRQDGRLVCVAGVHVFSPTFRAAALGNIAVLPEFRGRGLATAATAYLCRALLPLVDAVGLNVKADNAPAIACYRRLGFEWAADYTEFTLRLRKLP